MNVLSVFDGMSCGQIALQRAGVKVDNYFASEIDRSAIEVTMDNFPNTKQLGSILDLDTSTLPKIDLLIGGSPCQSFSLNGKRNGMSTKEEIEVVSLSQYLRLKSEGFEFEGQSYLFWEYVRILKELREVNPEIKFLLENVKMAKKWEQVLTEALEVQPVTINSNEYSAQDRLRLYWTNIEGENISPNLNLVLGDVLDLENKTVDFVIPKSMVVNEGLKYIQFDKSGKGYSSQQDRLRRIEYPSNCLAVGTSSIPRIVVEDDGVNLHCRLITAQEVERLQTIPFNYTKKASKTQRKKMLGNGWTVNVIVGFFRNLSA